MANSIAYIIQITTRNYITLAEQRQSNFDPDGNDKLLKLGQAGAMPAA
ncbi:hypothetical protein [Paenibacillus sp. GM2]|nr:hypothetical protein [Paenibacillus sp. GM2]